MDTKEKLIERFKRQPIDFTFDEMERLLSFFRVREIKQGENFRVEDYLSEWRQTPDHVA